MLEAAQWATISPAKIRHFWPAAICQSGHFRRESAETLMKRAFCIPSSAVNCMTKATIVPELPP